MRIRIFLQGMKTFLILHCPTQKLMSTSTMKQGLCQSSDLDIDYPAAL